MTYGSFSPKLLHNEYCPIFLFNVEHGQQKSRRTGTTTNHLTNVELKLLTKHKYTDTKSEENHIEVNFGHIKCDMWNPGLVFTDIWITLKRAQDENTHW